jgi:hypothetical protein
MEGDLYSYGLHKPALGSTFVDTFEAVPAFVSQRSSWANGVRSKVNANTSPQTLEYSMYN